MFPNINKLDIYLVCGKINLRKGIDGLAALVLETFDLDVYDNAIFLFCGTRADRFKALYWDKQDLCFTTKELIMDIFNGHEVKMKFVDCNQVNFVDFYLD